MRVVIFGISGFIGREVASLLEEQGVDIVGVSRSSGDSEFIQADVADADDLKEIRGSFDAAIVCSAAMPRKTYTADDLSEFVKANVAGVLNVSEWARRAEVRHIIFCSTLSMLPTPSKAAAGDLIDVSSHYMYKVSKAAGEHLLAGFCREHRITHSIFRIASVYGPGMKPGIFHRIMDVVNRGEKFVLVNRNLTVDFVHVADVARAIVSCLQKPVSGIINAGSGAPVKLLDVANSIARLMGSKKLDVEIQADEKSEVASYSVESFNSLLGRPQVTLESGLKELVASLRE